MTIFGWLVGLDAANGFDAVHVRHVQVHAIHCGSTLPYSVAGCLPGVGSDTAFD